MRLCFAAVFGLLAGCAHGQRVTHLDKVTVTTVRRNHNNVHVVQTAAGMLLVDAGLERDAPALDAQLRRAGVDPADLKLIVITHGHADHAGGAMWFKARYGTPIMAGAADVGPLNLGQNEPLCPIGRIAQSRLDTDQNETWPGTQPDRLVGRDGTAHLADFGFDMLVYNVAGHTPGSLVLYAGDALVVGDLVRGRIVGHRPHRHFYMCDVPDNDADIRTLLEATATPDTQVFVGHFGPLDGAQLGRWVADAAP